MTYLISGRTLNLSLINKNLNNHRVPVSCGHQRIQSTS